MFFFNLRPKIAFLQILYQNVDFSCNDPADNSKFFNTFTHLSGGVADLHGGLKRGDQLIAVNGVVNQCAEIYFDKNWPF